MIKTTMPQLRKFALQELKNIKRFATQQEWNKLVNNIDSLHNQSNLCVYGQMTGSCYSDRAWELAVDCNRSGITFTGCSPTLRFVGEHKDQNAMLLGDNKSARFFTPMELYLAMKPEVVKRMILKINQA